MQNSLFQYFQFRKEHAYPVYIRIKNEDLNSKFSHLLHEIGFNELSDSEAKKVLLHKDHTKLLTVQFACSRLNEQMSRPDLDRYGHESLSMRNGHLIYIYLKVGLLSLPINKRLWDLALNPEISNTDELIGLRIILVRYLAQALAEFGILSYWGTVKDDSVMIMKQGISMGEAIFIDWNKKLIFSNSGEFKINQNLKIIRKDKEFSSTGKMGREELISFLSISTCLLAFNGITNPMKRVIIDMSAQVSGSYFVSESSINL